MNCLLAVEAVRDLFAALLDMLRHVEPKTFNESDKCCFVA